jgi:hypothetical protein
MLLRFRAGAIVPEPFEQIGALGKRRTIHLAFATRRLDGSDGNVMYVLTSSLLLERSTPATEEVIGFLFDKNWDALLQEEPVLQVTLPLQHTASHRIALADTSASEVDHRNATRSIIVTGLLASVLFQILPESNAHQGNAPPA